MANCLLDRSGLRKVYIAVSHDCQDVGGREGETFKYGKSKSWVSERPWHIFVGCQCQEIRRRNGASKPKKSVSLACWAYTARQKSIKMQSSDRITYLRTRLALE